MDNEYFRTEVGNLFRNISLKLNCVLKEFYEPYGITAAQALILAEVARCSPVKISDLAKELSMSNSNLSVICKRMEKNGFLRRKRDDDDQRVVFVTLTEKSEEILSNIGCQDLSNYLLALERATEEDKEIIMNGLARLEALLNENSN